MRRSIPLVAAALGAALTLAACGGGDTDTEDTGAATEETGGAGDGGTLTVWVDETRQAAVESAAAAFEEETGTTVETVLKNFDDIRADFLAQVPTGEGPDLTVGASDWLGEFTTNGVVAPVELGDLAGDFEEIAIEAWTYDGQIYGLPYAIENIAIIRNTALADSTPATFDEMIAQGRAAGTTYPFLVQVGEDGDPYTMYPFQTSFGAEVFAQDAEGAYLPELELGGEPGTAFAQWLKAQADAGVLSTSMTYDIAVEAFKNGESPYILGGPWMLSTFEGMDLAVDPIPSAGGEPARPFSGVPGFYVNAQSDNQLIASDFLTGYMATEEAQVALYEAGNRLPALTAAADVASEDPLTAGFRVVAEDALPSPALPEMGAVWSFWGATEAGIISGSIEPVAGWEKMVTDIQAAIDAAS
ncbi:extracellular solute-binding protein [Actinotalea sp. JY-7885]|uniref:sugar ABC transporter substrate-binding protein n=1 Tax=Actinotalea sp. JY-7885 TaxID=2758576 RepID=UPI00165E097A|nr:extracellular solute-binding protein [Actinotalea sp. JY-7885]